MPGTHPLQTGGEDHLATGRSIYFIERVLLLAGRDPETGRYPPSPPVVSSLSHREIFSPARECINIHKVGGAD